MKLQLAFVPRHFVATASATEEGINLLCGPVRRTDGTFHDPGCVLIRFGTGKHESTFPFRLRQDRDRTGMFVHAIGTRVAIQVHFVRPAVHVMARVRQGRGSRLSDRLESSVA